MNWRLIVLLSMLGLVLGVTTVWLNSTTIEPILWLGVFLFSAYQIARRAPGKYFQHGFLVNVANGVWIGIVHAVLFYQYTKTYPEYLAMTSALPTALAGHPRRLLLLIGPLTGVFLGIVLGLFSLIASRIVRNSTGSAGRAAETITPAALVL